MLLLSKLVFVLEEGVDEDILDVNDNDNNDVDECTKQEEDANDNEGKQLLLVKSEMELL